MALLDADDEQYLQKLRRNVRIVLDELVAEHARLYGIDPSLIHTVDDGLDQITVAYR